LNYQKHRETTAYGVSSGDAGPIYPTTDIAGWPRNRRAAQQNFRRAM
jgi:hypothetical protein